MNFEVFSGALAQAYGSLLSGVINFIPKFIVAILVIILGWLVGAAMSKLISQIVKSLRLDKGLEAAGVAELLNKGGYKLNSGVFLGELVKWFVIAVAFVATFDILGLTDLNIFLRGVVVGYIPQVIASVLILLFAALVGPALQKTITASAKAGGFRSANMLGAITKWSIWIFALMAAIFQLNIAPTFIQTLFTGFIVALSLALGLAFGLGGKEVAKEYLEKLVDEAKDRD